MRTTRPRRSSVVRNVLVVADDQTGGGVKETILLNTYYNIILTVIVIWNSSLAIDSFVLCSVRSEWVGSCFEMSRGVTSFRVCVRNRWSRRPSCLANAAGLLGLPISVYAPYIQLRQWHHNTALSLQWHRDGVVIFPRISEETPRKEGETTRRSRGFEGCFWPTVRACYPRNTPTRID